MRILITGATGFTGRHLISKMQAAGHVCLALRSNLTNIEALRSDVASCGPVDAVVHLAGISFVGHSDNAAFYSVNTVGTSNLLEVLASTALQAGRPPVRVLIASSANVYGNCENSPIAENQPPAPVNHYAASKLAMEHMALTFSDHLQIVIARPFNYTGPGQTPPFLIPKIVDHFVRRADVIELGNLHVEREFNDVRMVCEAYLGLLAHGAPGQIYNVCTGRPHTLQSVLDTLTELTGHHLNIQVNPELVRANEVHSLSGNPDRMHACLGPLTQYDLKDTLLAMMGNGFDAPHQS